MTRFIKNLALYVFLSPLILAKPAAATLSALISIHEGSTDMWEQRAGIQELLHTRFGFDDVRFLVDATPEETPARLKRFLEEAAGPDDRRLVWVSGFNQRQDSTVCAARNFQTIRPKAASMILAPSCYTDIISLPQGTRHFSMTSPTPETSIARIGRTRATNSPWIAVLTLPSSSEAVIHGTNTLIFDHLNSSTKGHLDPAALLQHLRSKFRWNGSDFTPTLDYFDRGLARKDMRPFGINRTVSTIAVNSGGHPVRFRKPVFGLYAKPDARDGLVMSVQAGIPVRGLRRDRDGQMYYVAVGTSHFGWVKSDDLVK